MSDAAEDDALVRLAAALRDARYRFVTPTPATHAIVNARLSSRQALDLAGVFGWSRPFASELLPERMLGLMTKAGILASEGGLFRSRVRFSSLGDELFVHSAYPTVSADSVFFGPDTYRFARAIRSCLRDRSEPIRRAVDIGCGAGPGGILVAKSHPEADIVLVDINDAALRIAEVNARIAGTPNAVAHKSDLLSGVPGEFDLIVSNPPYLNDPLERAYRHGGGALGADLSQRIVDTALERLAPGGTLLLYTGVAIVNGQDPFAASVRERLGSLDVAVAYEEIDPDVFGNELATTAYVDADRIAAVVLTVTRSPHAERDR